MASNVDHLKADLDALRETNAILRADFERNGLAATLGCQNARRACADSQRVRSELFRVRLPRESTSPGLARRLVGEHLDGHHPEEIADARTVVSELVTNAVVHGCGVIELRLSRRRGRIRIEVTDEGRDAVVRAGTAERPHGLDIVETVSLAWGAHEGSTHVWAELRVSTPSAGRLSALVPGRVRVAAPWRGGAEVDRHQPRC